jgi:uracil-DNA glycosylase
MSKQPRSLRVLLDEIRACSICADSLPLGPRPILAASARATVLIAGQAPGAKVHASGVPWDDPSGNTLRVWMGIDRETFYDATKVAIVPMGFCYPGKGSSGDLPPRPECAAHWHTELLQRLTGVQLTLVIGTYAQGYHLRGRQKATLTETVHAFREYLPQICVLPHPAPRNRPWLTKHAWFEQECLPLLRARVAAVLDAP